MYIFSYLQKTLCVWFSSWKVKVHFAKVVYLKSHFVTHIFQQRCRVWPAWSHCFCGHTCTGGASLSTASFPTNFLSPEQNRTTVLSRWLEPSTFFPFFSKNKKNDLVMAFCLLCDENRAENEPHPLPGCIGKNRNPTSDLNNWWRWCSRSLMMMDDDNDSTPWLLINVHLGRNGSKCREDEGLMDRSHTFFQLKMAMLEKARECRNGNVFALYLHAAVVVQPSAQRSRATETTSARNCQAGYQIWRCCGWSGHSGERFWCCEEVHGGCKARRLRVQHFPRIMGSWFTALFCFGDGTPACVFAVMLLSPGSFGLWDGHSLPLMTPVLQL